jgi:mRNA interferase RelE/StbE
MIIHDIEKAKNVLEIRNLKKLKGYKDFYRLRIGDYRIGLQVKNNNVIFVRILHRKEIYKYFP